MSEPMASCWVCVLQMGQMVDIPGMNMGSAEYFPYIYYRINLDLLDQQRL